MNTYDYKIVPFLELKKAHYDDRLDVDKLNELGIDGWELVGIFGLECVFKKLVKRRVVNRM
jgi:hypothetical protein